MSNINELSSVTPSASQLIPVWDTPNGVSRQFSLTALVTFVESLLSSLGGFVSQFYAPNATGFSVTIAPPVNGQSVWLVLTPTGTFAAGTIVLPPVANCIDQQEVLVNCTQIVTALTVNGNGATVNGAPTTLAAANGFFRLRFESTAASWYRVG